MNYHHLLVRKFASALCVLALLVSASAAWAQTTQIKKTFAVHGGTTLATPDFEKGTVTETVSDPAKMFVDIAFGSGPDSLLAASGTELLQYPAPPAGCPQPVQDFSDFKMRSILAIAVDPNTETAYVFAETKGKPTFKLLIGGKSKSSACWTFDGTIVQAEFPKFIDAVAIEGGILAADEKAIYSLAAPDYSAVRVADKRFIGLLGPESITGLAVIPDSGTVLLGTDRRRLLRVDLTAGTVTAFGGSSPLSTVEPCVSDRDQIIGIAAGRTGESATAVVVTDFACKEVRLFDEAGTKGVLASENHPEDPATTEGEVLDLTACANPDTGCDWAAPGVVNVTIANLSGPSSEAVLRQVTGMVDPRCSTDTAVPPELVPLNLNDLLPDEVLNLGIVPDPMWVPPWLQGDPVYSCEIGAFIVTTADDTRTGVVDGTWEVHQLLGTLNETRCVEGLLRDDAPDTESILDWDLIGYSPTRPKTLLSDYDDNATYPDGFELTPANVGCGSGRANSRELSVFLYGLAIPYAGDDTLVEVTAELLTDLGRAIDELAAPLLGNDHQIMLQNRYLNLMDKWSKAHAAFYDNQQNAADTTLNAVVAQLQNLQYENDVEVTYCPDPICVTDVDNIQGEVSIRIEVLLFLIEERLRPSIPLGGLP